MKLSAAGKLTGAGAKPVTQEQMDLSRLRAESVRPKRECEILKNGPHGAPITFCIYIFIESNRGHQLTSSSEILTREIHGLPCKSSRYRYRTLSFGIANHIRYRVFRRNADADIHVIRDQISFHNLTFLLFRQLAQCPAKILADHSKYHFDAPFQSLQAESLHYLCSHPIPQRLLVSAPYLQRAPHV